MTDDGNQERLAGYLRGGGGDDGAATARAERLRRAVAAQPVAGPSAGFFDRALDVAAREGSRGLSARVGRSGWRLAVGSALAAGIAVWLVAGPLLRTPAPVQPPSIPGLTLALHESRTVNLMFASANELRDATLVVQLPPGVEVAGYRGQREIRWSTQLRQGRNVLPLELIASAGHGGELIARIEHASKRKTFRLNVTVT